MELLSKIFCVSAPLHNIHHYCYLQSSQPQLPLLVPSFDLPLQNINIHALNIGWPRSSQWSYPWSHFELDTEKFLLEKSFCIIHCLPLCPSESGCPKPWLWNWKITLLKVPHLGLLYGDDQNVGWYWSTKPLEIGPFFARKLMVVIACEIMATCREDVVSTETRQIRWPMIL